MSCIAVVGCGSHCRAIVSLLARSGASVRVIPWHPHEDRRGLWGIDDTGRVEVYRHLEAAYECDLVVISVPGGLDLQREALAAVEQRVSAGAALAVDTSAAPLTEQVPVLERPEQAVGLRFPRPLEAWDLVEVTPSQETAPGVHMAVLQLCQQLGRHAYEPVDLAGAAE